MGIYMVQLLRGWGVVGAMMVCMLVTVSQQSAISDQDNLQTKRQRRSVSGGGSPFQQLVDALQIDSVSNPELFMHYTPTTPAPQDINCYVEVPTTLRKGGRCIQLGRRGMSRSRNGPWACQAGIHLALSSTCGTPWGRAQRPGRG